MTEWHPPDPSPPDPGPSVPPPPTYPPPPAYQPVYGPAYSQPYGQQPGYAQARTRRPGGRMIVIAAVVAAVVGGGVGAGTVAALGHGSRTVDSKITFSTATAQNGAKIDGSITAAAARIQPSVVTINVAGSSDSGTGSGIILRTD